MKPDNAYFTLVLSRHFSAKALRHEIQMETGTPPEKQAIRYHGRYLEDICPFSEFDQSGSTIYTLVAV
ncbi:hypothetical protein BC829DRAFT_398505 [Chytridium lagenaria]|nr:hypothetical protein BC829DRAFT_398505 [Chytridium lagenaria]